MKKTNSYIDIAQPKGSGDEDSMESNSLSNGSNNLFKKIKNFFQVK